MTFLLVAVVWIGLAFLACLLFAALVRGGRSTQADPEDELEAVEIPRQRVSYDGSRTTVGT